MVLVGKYGFIGYRKQNAHHGRHAQMNTPLKSRSTAILGTATVPGRPQEVSGVRAFVARTLSAADKRPPLDSDAATLLTSELVANAIQHTASGTPGGTVTIVVVDVPDGVLVEVIDDGSDGTPVVRRDVLTTNGHGLLLVQQLAAQWGYLRDPAGTTVWFHLSSSWSPDGG
jgi:anti-sigma regulatory factor (Ser/Thr protein kinase)